MGRNSVVSGHPKATEILRVDGFSTGPPNLGCHNCFVLFLLLFCWDSLFFFNNCLQNTKLMNIPHFGIKIDLKLLKTCHKNR